MTYYTWFRGSVVSDIRERVRDLVSPLRFMIRRSSLVECVSVLHRTWGVYLSYVWDVLNMFQRMKWYGVLCANKQNCVWGVPRFEVVQKESRWQNRLSYFFTQNFFYILLIFLKLCNTKEMHRFYRGRRDFVNCEYSPLQFFKSINLVQI